jgi:glycosyltransferase involved in cell wall biosynthesis
MQWSICLMANSWIKKIAPTKILASWAYPDAVAAVEIAKKHKAEFYLKVHGSDINMHATVPERAKQITAMANQAIGILSVSQDLANKMVAIDINKEKIKVIYNGVNLEKFKPYTTNTDSPYIIFIGNLKHEKGVIELLNAFIQLHSNYSQFTLKYVGGGPMLGKLKNMVRQHQLENKVIFEGIIPHDQLPKLIGQATLLALPSYNEGVPNVVLEAMACATPVVVTNVGGIPEVVTAETGIIAKEITAECIAECLQQALDKSWDHIAIREHAEIFNWAKNTTELASLLALKED